MRIRRIELALVTVVLAGMLLFAAEDAATREKAGAAKLRKDLAEAKRLKRPAWAKTMPMPVTFAPDFNAMGKPIGDFIKQGKVREALRIQYELIDRVRDPRTQNHLAQRLLMAGEPAFALLEYEKRSDDPLKFRDVSRGYLAYDQYKTAVSWAQKSLKAAASSGQKDFDEAKAYMAFGDIYRKADDFAKAKESYAKAGEAFQRAAAPGQNAAMFQRGVARMKDLDAMCDGLPTLDVSKLKDGTYEGRGSGYSGEVAVSVTLAGGKITKLDYVRQNESIPFSALHDMQREIVAKQTPSVDATTGATITSQAVMTAAYDALKKAE